MFHVKHRQAVLAFVLGFLLMMALSPAFAWQAIDGDTVRDNGVTYRLLDLDTPEIFRPRCKAERMLGLKAKERLQALLDTGPVSTWTDGKRDRYRRTLLVLLVANERVDVTLIREGLAVPYHCPKNRCPRRINWCAP